MLRFIEARLNWLLILELVGGTYSEGHLSNNVYGCHMKWVARWGSMLKAYLYALFPPASGAGGRKWLQTWSRGLRKSTPEREFSHVLCFITFQLLHIENRPNIFLTLENLKFCWFSENNTSTLTANFSA